MRALALLLLLAVGCAHARVDDALADGFESKTDLPGTALAIRSQRAMGSISVVPAAMNEVLARRQLDAFARGVAHTLGVALAPDGPVAAVELGWGRGYLGRWHAGEVAITAAVGPLCDGHLGLEAATVEHAGSTSLTDGDWLRQLAVHSGDVPACRSAAAGSAP